MCNNASDFTPGSDLAIEQGCTCPVLSNNYGKGTGLKTKAGEKMFWKAEDCPIHGSGLNVDLKAQLSQGRNGNDSVKPIDCDPHSTDE